MLVTKREEEDYHTTHTTAAPPTVSEDNRNVSSQDDEDEDDIEPNRPLRKYSINAVNALSILMKKIIITKYCVCIPSSYFLSIRDTAVVYVFTL